MTFGIILVPKICGKKLSKFQIDPDILEKNSNVHAIKILLDSGASTSIVQKDFLAKCHRIIKI